MSPHPDTLSLFRANQSLPFLLNAACVLSGEATNTNFIDFDLTRSGLEPTICHTRGEHANHYIIDAFQYKSKRDRESNGKKDKRTNNDQQNTTQKTKNRATRIPLKISGGLWKGYQFLLHV